MAIVAAVAVAACLLAVPVSILSIGIGHPSGMLWVSKLVLPYVPLFLKAARPSHDTVLLMVMLYFVLPVLQAVLYSYYLMTGPARARLAVGAVHAAAVVLAFVAWPGFSSQ